MAIRIGINGFGRIGRLVYREAVRRGDFEDLVDQLVKVDWAQLEGFASGEHHEFFD